MSSKTITVGLVLALVSIGFLSALVGCPATLLLNQTAERTGNITVTFINETPYRASFTFGTWDALDRSPPGPISFGQDRLEGMDSAQATQLCARNFAVGTQDMYDRIVEAADLTEIDVDAFDTVVHFSDAAAGSNLEAVATVGTALGIEKLLGIDFTCGDQLIFTFVQDPDAVGGFRIDYAVVPDE